NVDWLTEWSWPVLANAKTSKTDYAHALRCARKLVELAPHRPYHLTLLGAALYRTGDLDGARKMLDTVQPASMFVPYVRGPANLFLAMVHHKSGRPDEAAKVLAIGERVNWGLLQGEHGALVDEARALLQQK
ncbi:MAG: hypothetical protein ACI91B_004681, partial [Planctomycetota bacterium]